VLWVLVLGVAVRAEGTLFKKHIFFVVVVMVWTTTEMI
jgi:hypothetical protein